MRNPSRHLCAWFSGVVTPIVEDTQYAHPTVRGEIPEAASRAVAAGAHEPLVYIGAGMTAHIFCEKGPGARGFKVARRRSDAPASALFLEDEAEWLALANQIPGVREHVAEFYGYDPVNVVIIRECAVRRNLDWWRPPKNTWEIHKRIGKIMEQYGWGTPEYKEDSYVATRRGTILVDASMAIRLGRNAVAYALDVLSGRRQIHNQYTTLKDLAYYVRREVTEGAIPQDIGNHIIRRIAVRDPAALEWLVR